MPLEGLSDMPRGKEKLAQPAEASRMRRVQPTKKSVACSRCHAQKSKCSGETPCARCKVAGHGGSCKYVSRDRKIRVDESYFEQLVNDSQELQRQRAGSSTVSDIGNPKSADSVQRPIADGTTASLPFRIGETACTAFATRVSQCLNNTKAATYPLQWNYVDESVLDSLQDQIVDWPSLVQARLLLQTLFTNLNPVFHLVPKKDTFAQLNEIYRVKRFNDRTITAKYFALFALGKLYSALPANDGTPIPGLPYFAKALALAHLAPERPNMMHLETILTLALFQKSLNRFHAASLLVGSALRLALSLGLPGSPNTENTRPVDREHRTRIWWSIYTMDRFWGLKSGLPVQMDDAYAAMDLPTKLLDDVEEQLPDPVMQIAGISLARLARKISQVLYGTQKPQDNFLQLEQTLLLQSRQWIEDLPDDLKLRPGGNNLRNITVLHLQFNYCVILAIRPALLHTLSRRAKTAGGRSHTMPGAIVTILETCTHAAKHSLSLCVDAWTNGFIGLFSYDFPAYLFSAALVLLVTGYIQEGKFSDMTEIEVVMDILQSLASSGNIASKGFHPHLQYVVSCFEGRNSASEVSGEFVEARSDLLSPSLTVEKVSSEENNSTFDYDPLAMSSEITTQMALGHSGMQDFLDSGDVMGDVFNLFNDPLSPFWWLEQPLYTE